MAKCPAYSVLSKCYDGTDTKSVERLGVLMWDTAMLTEQGFTLDTDPRLNCRTTSGSNLERNDFQPFPNLPLRFYFLILVAAAIEDQADTSGPKWSPEETSA